MTTVTKLNPAGIHLKALPADLSASLAKAFERHLAARAKISATNGEDERAFSDACSLERDALEALAATRCANDTEFFVKAQYLIECEMIDWGSTASFEHPFGLVALAVKKHMKLPDGPRPRAA